VPLIKDAELINLKSMVNNFYFLYIKAPVPICPRVPKKICRPMVCKILKPTVQSQPSLRTACALLLPAATRVSGWETKRPTASTSSLWHHLLHGVDADGALPPPPSPLFLALHRFHPSQCRPCFVAASPPPTMGPMPVEISNASPTASHLLDG
jgi:hypothetical protein